jgi:hypothetical protein
MMVVLFTPSVYADCTIDNSNAIVQGNNVIIQGVSIFKLKDYKSRQFDVVEIKRALDEVSFDYKKDFTVYVLSYQELNQSASGFAVPSNVIALFGYSGLIVSTESDRIIVHELGHLVYFGMTLKEQNDYMRLRGLSKNATCYSDLPEEVFAEDFRILFGGEGARISTHNNTTLKSPTEIKGLKELIQKLED